MGNLNEKEEEGQKIEDSKDVKREKRNGVDYRKEETCKILNKYGVRFDGKEELSVVYESD